MICPYCNTETNKEVCEHCFARIPKVEKPEVKQVPEYKKEEKNG